jgi:DNA modification methylase
LKHSKQAERRQIDWIETGRLIENPNNARDHRPKQIKLLADSMREFGLTQPILVDPGLNVVAGHGRLRAAKLLDLPRVPTICLDHLSEAQRRAYAIADNRLGDLSSFDRKKLAHEIELIIEDMPEFDLELTGFDLSSVELILDQGEPSVQEHRGPPTPGVGPAVTRPGDLWRVGRHHLLCGDATDPGSYRRLLGRRKAQLVLTDPPYNVKIDGHVSGNGRVKHREFVMASGEMSEEEFIRFLTASLTCLAKSSADGSLHYIFMDWAHLFELLSAGRSVYDKLVNICVWNKQSGGLGSPYRSQHELVTVFKHGHRNHINNVELGKHGRNRTNVWDYPGMSTFSSDREKLLSSHPTPKPNHLIADVIRDASRRGGLVLDGFGGSGTTLIAAEQTDREAALVELDPIYCDVTLRRAIEAGLPVMDADSRTFADREALTTGEPL